MKGDPYEYFAAVYDRFHDDFGELGSSTEAFFERLLDKHNAKKILDCACGIGQHLALLHKGTSKNLDET